MLKTILVTGVTGNLGLEVARRFVKGGCQVLGTILQSGAEPIEGVQFITMDVTDLTSIETALKNLSTEIHGLVHCAGGFRFLKTEQLTPKDYQFLMDLNLKSALFLAHALIPQMRTQNFGRLIFIGSAATLRHPGTGMGAYAASKAGINMLVSSLADEVRAYDINVNAVLPSTIDTPINRKDMPQADFSQWVKPSDLADIIFSLTQPWGKAIHGALLPVTGRL